MVYMQLVASTTCCKAAMAARAANTANSRRLALPHMSHRAGHLRVSAIASPWARPAPSFQPPAPHKPLLPAEQPAPRSPAHGGSTAAPSVPLLHGILDIWHMYLKSLTRRPLLTKAATSFFCVCVGDGIAQWIGGAPFNFARVMRIACYSATMGAATGHYWHRVLEHKVCPTRPTSERAVLTKMCLDQLVFTPIMTAVFFTALKLMEGQPDAILPFLQEKYLPTLLAGYVVWFPWNYASFKWIPQDLRILAGNLVGIAWGTFVSVNCFNSSSSGGISSADAGPSVCPTAISAAEGVPAACPAVMAAVEAATMGPQ